MPVFVLDNSLEFPHPKYSEPTGLLAIGGDLKIERLLLAYKNGIFPWYSEGNPILWFSPDPRLILLPRQLRVSKNLGKVIKSQKFKVKFDTCFEDVIFRCAKIRRKNQDGTWITNEMVDAYIKLHEEGLAHSVESFYEGELVGGLYGVSLGAVFFGESMFYSLNNASKVALYYLVRSLESWKFDFIDSQIPTDHMKSLGAREIDRDSFLKMLEKSLNKKTIKGSWNAGRRLDKTNKN